MKNLKIIIRFTVKFRSSLSDLNKILKIYNFYIKIKFRGQRLEINPRKNNVRISVYTMVHNENTVILLGLADSSRLECSGTKVRGRRWTGRGRGRE